MTHTKGPWTVGEDHDVFSDEACIAQVVNAPEHIPEALANARLIAAAPALYALAQHVCALTEDAYLQGHPEWVAIAEEAHVAVCTAEGRRP